jgi:hypothetical protein
MERFSAARRAELAGAYTSILVIAAGVVALQGEVGVMFASWMLTGACAVAVIGVMYAQNRRLGWGVALLLTAALPLFIPLYLAGMAIFRHLGAGVAGALLIGAGVAIALWMLWHATKASRSREPTLD